MHLTQIAIHRPVTTLMLSAALVFLGVISWRELPVQELPDITFPTVYFAAGLVEGDLTPEETNQELTRPLEKLVASLPRLKEMRTTTRSGRVWGVAHFRRGTDVRFRVIDLQDKIGAWRTESGRDIQAQVIPFSTAEMAGELMELVLSVPVGREHEVAACSDLIRRRLRSLDGVAEVDIAGEVLPNVTLETTRDALLADGLSVAQLVEAVNRRARDKAWLGSVEEGRETVQIHLDDKVTTLDELLAARLDAQGVFTLGSVVRTDREFEEPKSVFRFNGKKAVRIVVTKEKDRNTVRMARAVRGRVEGIESELPPGFELTVTHDAARFLEKLIRNLAKLASLGAVLAMLVLLVFVRSWRVALIVGVAIPASVVITFNAMYGVGLTINILSLLGLAAGVGMLVDNAIVVVENVFRHSRHRSDPREAAWLGSREVARAILVSTATNLAVFLPLLFRDDSLALIMREMALSLVFPMVVSLFVAMTLIPMLTSKVLGAAGAGKGREVRDLPATSLRVRLNPWQKPGRRPRSILKELVFFAAKGALRHPVRLFACVAATLLVTLFASVIKIATQRFSQADRTRRITLYGRPPLGSDIEAADGFFLAKETAIRQELSDSDVFESFSSRFSRDGGEITLRVAEEYQRLNERQFVTAYRRLRSGNRNSGFRFYPFPEAARVPRPRRGRWGQWSAFADGVLVTGENMEAMVLGGKLVKDFLEEAPEVLEARVETPPGPPEAHFHPDLELFKVRRADPRALQTFFRSRSSRGVRTSLTLEEGDARRQVNVRAVSPEEEAEAGVPQTLADLRRAQVPLQGGGVMTLDDLGTFAIARGVPAIVKKNRQRNLRVGFTFREDLLQHQAAKKREIVLKRLQREINGIRLPTGISAGLAGTLQESKTERESWKKVLWQAILAVYLVMAFCFESLISPFVILLTLPLACIGGIWGILLFNSHLDSIAMTGTIILAGLVVNNGILLVEYTQQMQRQAGYRRSRALLAAVSYRYRPILMTSLTTVLGLLPILLSPEAGREARSLVSVLVGGLLASGILSLVVIPAFYNVLCIGFERLAAWQRWVPWHVLGAGFSLPQTVPAPAEGPAVPVPLADTRGGGDADAERLTPTGPALSVRGSRGAAVLPPEQLGIRILNVTKIYPRFRARYVGNVIPSRSYPYGHRPPTGTVALTRVSLDLTPGMFGLLGPNGAGKTTLMKILTGIVRPSYGVVEIAGRDPRFDPRGVRSLISYLPQSFGVYGSLTLEQYLTFLAPYCGLDDLEARRRRIDEVIDLVGLRDARGRRMKSFSGGMQQRAGVAQLLLAPRPVIIVDEPTAGLDPVERVRFRLLLSELARERIVVLSTHIVDDITSSCKRVAVLSQGSVVYDGGVDGIQRSAAHRVWDLVHPARDEVAIERRQILYRKHVGDRVLYHYVSDSPLPGSTPADATFEDAYVSLLIGREEEGRGDERRTSNAQRPTLKAGPASRPSARTPT